MGFEKLLRKHRIAITKQWFDLVVRTYPANTQQFLKSQKDPFANPVGQTTLDGLQKVFDQVVDGIDPGTVGPLLDPIIRIRAVQDFSPSNAVAFIPDLKTIVRSAVGKGTVAEQPMAEWLQFAHNVDELTLIGFDIYMKCRERIFALKADNERTKVLRTFQRAGLLFGDPEMDTDSVSS